MLRVESLCLQPYWRILLSRFLPIDHEKVVVVNVPFEPSLDDDLVMIAKLPRYRARIVCKLRTGEIKISPIFGCSVVGWTVSASPVEALAEKLSAE